MSAKENFGRKKKVDHKIVVRRSYGSLIALVLFCTVIINTLLLAFSVAIIKIEHTLAGLIMSVMFYLMGNIIYVMKAVHEGIFDDLSEPYEVVEHVIR